MYWHPLGHIYHICTLSIVLSAVHRLCRPTYKNIHRSVRDIVTYTCYPNYASEYLPVYQSESQRYCLEHMLSNYASEYQPIRYCYLFTKTTVRIMELNKFFNYSFCSLKCIVYTVYYTVSEQWLSCDICSADLEKFANGANTV